ncbi:alpha/beta hydrolase [Salegentibacter sp. F188]|uniref:Alpha/beta hydrolase n=1 Tax=Autumnicola patrickiae TaxID=3075591 RepID=A0ABU3E6P9_9FLAO|nr:alpha/beta hydrolase [Salegentibacter sp. F188]MDT0691592.1 alpha/beta hydrolase [Salegentibacter sp. F188]
MKKIFVAILFLSFQIINSQSIFKYEREIENKANFNFHEIVFENEKAEIELSGTLITPKQNFNEIIIIVPGSTKDTRHSHFIIAEKFLENNIAVYRFDERGIGKSKGNYTDSSNKLSQDLGYLMKKLSDKFPNQTIGIFGHSRGGMASIELVENDVKPNFLILVGTPVIKNGGYVIKGIERDIDKNPDILDKGKSKEETLNLFKEIFEVFANNHDPKIIKKKAKELIKNEGFDSRYIQFVKGFLNDPIFMEVIRKDYTTTLETIEVPVLYLVGENDNILNSDLESDFVSSLENSHIKVIQYEGLNHYLTERNAPVGTSLYKIDKEPLEDIIQWIKNITVGNRVDGSAVN